MGKKRRSSPLEEKVFAAWENLTFRHGMFREGPISTEEYLGRLRNETPELLEILAMAHDGQEWKVGPRTASTVSTSLWHNAMTLGDYDLAEAAIERSLSHPEPFDRHDRAELPIKLFTARFVRDRSPTAAKALEDHIRSGIYRPSAMARWTLHWLLLFPSQDIDNEPPVGDEARSLALAIAVARGAGKRHEQSAASLQTWEEFWGHVVRSAGWTVQEMETM